MASQAPAMRTVNAVMWTPVVLLKQLCTSVFLRWHNVSHPSVLYSPIITCHVCADLKLYPGNHVLNVVVGDPDHLRCHLLTFAASPTLALDTITHRVYGSHSTNPSYLSCRHFWSLIRCYSDGSMFSYSVKAISGSTLMSC